MKILKAIGYIILTIIIIAGLVCYTNLRLEAYHQRYPKQILGPFS